MRILIIEDEETLLEQLGTRLNDEGYVVDLAPDGREGLYMGREYEIDLAIIDLGLPEISGISVIKQLRENKKQFPILVLTARGRWQDKVEGLEAGADDYMVKPFHIEELIARVKVLLRRSAGIANPVFTLGTLCINTTTQQVTNNNKVIELTAFEYKVFEYLLFNPAKVISKTELTEHIYDQDFERDSNVIEVFIGRLRKKLDPRNRLNPIETLRGRGYRINQDLIKQ